MNPATLGDLKKRALDHADMAGSDFPDDARLVDYVNDALSELHELLAIHDYLRSKSTITLTAGTEEYLLPSDFYKLSRAWKVSSGRRYVIDKFTLAQLDGHSTTGPSAGATVELWYVPQLKRLKEDGDTVSVALPIGWESYAALHMAVQLLIREESDPSALIGERDRVKARVLGQVEPRDAGLPDEIEDYYGRWNGAILDVAADRTLRYRVLGNKILFVEFDYLGV